MKNVQVIYPGEFKVAFEIDCNESDQVLLERVFAMFNRGSGKECALFVQSRCRSLSARDVVSINGIYYQCKSIGWRQVSRQYVDDLENEVLKHPNRADGAWFALQDVMRRYHRFHDPDETNSIWDPS